MNYEYSVSLIYELSREEYAVKLEDCLKKGNQLNNDTNILSTNILK